MIERASGLVRPFVLADAALLLGGVLLTSFNLLLLGWSVYAVGHVGLIVGLAWIGYLSRDRMDAWAWAGLGVLLAGLVAVLPQIATIWQAYTATPTRGVMLVPPDAAPMGRIADLTVWIGLAFFGLAGRGARVLSGSVGWVFVLAAVIGIVADLAVAPQWIPTLWWVPAMLVFILGLVAIGGGLRELLEAAPVAAEKA